MSKRNLVLILIVLVLIVGGFLGYLYLFKPKNNINGESSGTNFLSDFFPFGKKNKPNTNTETPIDISGYTPPEDSAPQAELLTKISSMPIAGYGVSNKERYMEIQATTTEEEKLINTELSPPAIEFVPNIRYVEKATGNIYQTFVDKIDERKFTTTVIPQVYDAYFGDKNNSVIMRYLKADGKTIESFVGKLPKDILGGDISNENEIKGTFLPENITDISISPDNSSVFYIFNAENNAIGITALSSGDKKNQILSSSFTEWLSQWPNPRMITLTTKPSYDFSGFLYYIDPTIKKMTKVFGNIKGLTTLTSPSGKLILYGDNTLSLRIYNTSTKDSMPLGVKTMPEKCVWNSSSTTIYCAVPKYIQNEKYPDAWYQGEVSFSDDIWKVNVENGSTENIADPDLFTRGENVDAIKLSLDENENYLFFINKKDSYLWELKIK